MGYLNKCKHCDREWQSSHPGKFCSSNCNHLFKQSEARKTKNLNFVCLNCRSTFVAKKANVKFCSSKCNNAYIYRQKDKSYYAAVKRAYYSARPGVVAKQRKERYYKDLNFKIACVLRARLKEALKNSAKTGSAVADLGCSIEELKKYLESKFKPGMTWQNWSKTGWHIDHIRPLSSFDLTDPEQVKIACHYSNLQPLWASENISKGGV